MLAGDHGDHRRDGAFRGRDRRDHAHLPDPQAAVDEQEPGDVADAGKHEPGERAAVERLRLALGQRHRPDDDEAGQHHPRQRRLRPDQRARPGGGQHRDRPGDSGAEAAQDSDHAAPSLARTRSRRGSAHTATACTVTQWLLRPQRPLPARAASRHKYTTRVHKPRGEGLDPAGPEVLFAPRQTNSSACQPASDSQHRLYLAWPAARASRGRTGPGSRRRRGRSRDRGRAPTPRRRARPGRTGRPCGPAQPAFRSFIAAATFRASSSVSRMIGVPPWNVRSISDSSRPTSSHQRRSTSSLCLTARCRRRCSSRRRSARRSRASSARRCRRSGSACGRWTGGGLFSTSFAE